MAIPSLYQLVDTCAQCFKQVKHVGLVPISPLCLVRENENDAGAKVWY